MTDAEAESKDDVSSSVWQVQLLPSAMEDLKWYDSKTQRIILEAARARLGVDPLAESRHSKTLRPNPVAQRELRLFGHYRVLFDMQPQSRTIVIKVIGKKRGNKLQVRGKSYEAHHEADHSQ